VLFLWLVLRPVLTPDQPADLVSGGYDPIGGLFHLVALSAAAAALSARRGDAPQTGLIANGEVAYAVGPLLGAVAFALADTSARLGLAGAAGALPLVLPVVVAVIARLRLPPTSAVVRRALVTPFILAASGFFGQFLAGPTGIFDLRQMAQDVASGRLAETLFVVGIGIVGMLLFYLMLIFAPRQIVERECSPSIWGIRFAVFVVGLSLGTTLSGLVRGG